jgi:hypothetical protein
MSGAKTSYTGRISVDLRNEIGDRRTERLPSLGLAAFRRRYHGPDGYAAAFPYGCDSSQVCTPARPLKNNSAPLQMVVLAIDLRSFGALINQTQRTSCKSSAAHRDVATPCREQDDLQLIVGG